MTPHSRRLIKTIAASLFVLLLAGVTYQGVATALERRTFKYPGRLVPVGDHQLHVHCVGTGAPVVVLEAPALGFSASWTLVQAAIEPTTRVCAYDRAGLGWSEASDRPFTWELVPEELHTLLAGAGEPAPYVLVGEGLGAAFAAHFAAQYPQDTAGLVLLNAPGGPDERPATRARTSPSPWLARTGVLRLSRLLSSTDRGSPGPPGGALDAFAMRPDHLTRSAQEVRQANVIASRANALALSPDLPVRRLESSADPSLLSTAPFAAQVTTLARDVVADWRRTH